MMATIRHATGRRLSVVLSALGLLAITGCGGGGSSSGGGGGTPAQHAGTYAVSGSVTVTAANGVSTTVPFSDSVIVISSAGTVTVDPDTPFTGTGALAGNAFSVVIPAASLNDAELVCSGSVTLSGTLSGNNLNGTISGNDVVCNGIMFTVTGTFSGSKSTAALRPGAVQKTVSEAIRNAIGSAF